MSVYFSEKFKRLRKSKDLTQEQIADIFHVSPQSVSRWEIGANYPDVELLPHLAIFFDVTLDELLGTSAIRSEEKVKEYIRDIRNLLNSGKVCDAIELARKSVKEYPLHYNLQYLFLQALNTDGSDKHKDEIIAVGEKVINSHPGNYDVKTQLVQLYAGWNMKEEARKILDTMPGEIWNASEVWSGLILEGEEWLKNQKSRIIRATMLLGYLMSAYIGKGGLDSLQKIEYKKAMLQIEDMASRINGHELDSVHSAVENILIAELYLELNDNENALDYAEKATLDAMRHIEQMHKTNEDDGGNYMAWATPRNLPWILWEDYLSKPQFDIVRADERFIKCFESLKSNSRELK